ncbi:potassium channel family protein [Marinomonas foliarum]|uniref:Pentapeptide repeat protein n=1 Tax=Marinomonas foliarum TaxID=491950 RepID=A0A369AEV7_9GAMM|nr:potassium channel family protein [Marinomonas foliarum]RCX07721.1 pentapeptide repeat protein [Marinomonas foliarum]
MAANKFSISGTPNRTNSLEEFLNQEQFLDQEDPDHGFFEDVLYFPEQFNPGPSRVLKQKRKTYKNVSFKDTEFRNVSFVSCVFNGCLLLSSKFIDCEFIDCTFIDTNTNKSQFEGTLIDPAYFKNNFDLKADTNIAADLYHSLYKNLSNERQPDRAKQSLYMMHRAENAHLNSQYKRGRIGIATFLWKKSVHLFDFLTSGYGLKLYRVFLTFLIVVSSLSLMNYIFRDDFFKTGKICSLMDSIYFTIVTLTTLGYGDVYPQTQLGKAVIAGEVTLGIVIISLFLTSVSSRVIRS